MRRSHSPSAVLAALVATPVRLHARVASADREAGMTTAEYAVGTVAACGFGGILYKVITSPQVLGLVRDMISAALRLPF